MRFHLSIIAAGLVATLSIGGCEQNVDESAESAKEERVKPAPGPAAKLSAPAPPPEGELAERLIQHLDAMRRIAGPITEFCDEASRDLTEYLDLARADFEAGADATFDDDEKGRLATAYIALANVSGRCFSDPKGKALNLDVQALVKPLELPLGG